MDRIVEGVRWSLPTGVRWSPVRPGGVTDATGASDGRMATAIGIAVLLAVVAVAALVLARHRRTAA